MRKLAMLCVGLCLAGSAGCRRQDIQKAKELLHSTAAQYELLDIEFAAAYREKVEACLNASYDWPSFDNCVAQFEMAAQLLMDMRLQIFYTETQLVRWENGAGSEGFRSAACDLYSMVKKLEAFLLQHGLEFKVTVKGLKC